MHGFGLRGLGLGFEAPISPRAASRLRGGQRPESQNPQTCDLWLAVYPLNSKAKAKGHSFEVVLQSIPCAPSPTPLGSSTLSAGQKCDKSQCVSVPCFPRCGSPSTCVESLARLCRCERKSAGRKGCSDVKLNERLRGPLECFEAASLQSALKHLHHLFPF